MSTTTAFGCSVTKARTRSSRSFARSDDWHTTGVITPSAWKS
ncbi:Uncharacterised protein [Mycobacteroides abscessus subsp. abscessus]|nr:Uncharacterised protein [Mycobacteroides abscessus subsp. abscessus]